MRIGFKCFLVTAQTLHMGKTAEMLFLTQQAVSEHIKRLEKEYDTTLFYRKPKLSLTPSGAILLNGIEKISVIEANLKNELNGAKNESEGRIRLGIGTYRLHDIIPSIIVDFHQYYPSIRIDLLYDDNVRLEKLLLNGKIDLFTGFNVQENGEFERTILRQDQNCLLISESLMHSHYSQKKIKDFIKRGIHMDEVTPLPFLANYPDGSLWKSYQQELNRRNLELKIVFSSNDMSDLIHLCSLNYGAAFCSNSLETSVMNYNRTTNRYNRLNLIPIVDLLPVNKIELINHRQVFKSTYLSYFIDLICASRLTSISSPKENLDSE